MKNSLKLSIIGGTDVPFSPTSDYTKHVFSEALSRIGLNFTSEIKKRGYYPKGGGLVETQIQPCKNPRPISLLKRDSKTARLLCAYSQIPREVIEKETDTARNILSKNGFDCNITIKEENAFDKGCSMLVFSHDSSSVTGSDGIYHKTFNGLGESVAKRFIDSNLGVDLNLSD